MRMVEKCNMLKSLWRKLMRMLMKRREMHWEKERQVTECDWLRPRLGWKTHRRSWKCSQVASALLYAE
jgi:hypothetical protein